MFDFDVTEKGKCFKYKELLDNGQTIQLIFWSHFKSSIWSVDMSLYSKRKRVSNDRLVSTGKCGLKGLIAAKLIVECFILHLKEITPIGSSRQIVAYADDGKRRRIYEHYLKRLGFEKKKTRWNDIAMCIDVEGEKSD